MKQINLHYQNVNQLKLTCTSIMMFILVFISLSVSAQSNQLPGTSSEIVSNEEVFQDLLAKAEQQGGSRVIIELKIPTAKGPLLNFAKAEQHLSQINSVQKQVLEKLGPSSYRNVKHYKNLPYLAMELDAANLEVLRNDTKVKAIYEDKLHATQLVDSTLLIEATTTCNNGYCGQGQVIAILDTGVEANHSFLSNVVHQACFSTTAYNYSTTLCPVGEDEQIGADAATPCLYSGCYHGTHVAGIAAGNGFNSGVAFSGVAPNADIMAIQIFSKFTDPTCASFGASSPCVLSFTSDQLSALEHVYDQRGNYNIASVNMSLGGGLHTSVCDSNNPAMTAAINLLKSVNIATVVSSGNNGSNNSISSPACISSAISVGSTNKSDVISTFSNSASFLDLLAPGQSIKSSLFGDRFGSLSGTSMATPHVAGAFAVLRSADPFASVNDILNALKDTGVPVLDFRNGLSKPRIQLDSVIDEFVNFPPTVSINNPADSSTFTQGDNITFTSSASDSMDGNISNSISWSSDLNGNLGSGANISTSTLTVGTHTITASVTDSDGLSAADTIDITINALGGSIEIVVDNQDNNTSQTGTWNISGGSNPWDGQSVYNNGSNTFRWTPGVSEAGVYEVYVWWTYHKNRSTSVPYRVQSLDGLDTVIVNQKDQSLGGRWNLLGSYTFSADNGGYVEVSSENGQASADAVRFVKGSELNNLPPTVTIDNPANNSIFTQGDNISLTGSANDSEDGDLSTSIDWSSDLDGSLGTGTNISTSTLTEGTHIITASVTDSVGLNATNTVSITVNSFDNSIEIIVDNQDNNTTQTGTWIVSSGPNPWAGQSIYNNGSNTFRWTPNVPEAGVYEVYVWWTYHGNRSTNVPYRVQSLNSLDTVFVNQNDTSLGGQWNLLGNYTLAAGNSGYVELSSENGQASADAVRLVKVD